MSSDVLFTPVADTAACRINGERLWNSLMSLAEIGATPKGGCRRLTLTDLDRQGRDLVIGWARDAGLSVTVDKIGNVFMRREGRNPMLPPVVAGSHIDTQPTGGKFDGNYGVLAALEVVRTLNDLEIITEAPIEVVFWTNEEGSRFVPVMMGSGVFAGVFPLEEIYAVQDAEGKTVGDELARIGYIGSQTPGDHPVGAYFEAHIEQGPILEAEEKVIGVVRGVLGIRWYDCVVTGQESHAGPTPMDLRQDALQVATRIMQEVVAIAGRSEEGRGTVGMVQVYPNSRNVVPGEVTFSVDMRNLSDAAVDEMDRQLRDFIAQVQQESGMAIALKEVSHYPAAPFHPACQAAIAEAAERLGYPAREIVSGAGHDAVYMSYLAPTGMIFIPCRDGISHNEIEYASPEHVTAGANVLLQVMLQYARAV
ncbi:Zn-dependent hydrolase [Pseudescherichia vulneris]|uniref:Zn-dependent hydrolase n=1 Tax=Pseudescherichia vulneris TaxID=566 RepID=UPI00227C12AB|nr:Zn-dependent hydrolase [Pseudescherichia vulneris]WAH51604.1 Zn-dependent hydrolase [Pseudescherichia vulneris]